MGIGTAHSLQEKKWARNEIEWSKNEIMWKRKEKKEIKKWLEKKGKCQERDESWQKTHAKKWAKKEKNWG